RLLALIWGRIPFRGFALRRPIPGSGKIHHLSSGGGISHAGDRGLFLVLARLRRTRHRRSRSVLVFWCLRLGRGGLILRRRIDFDRFHLSRLGGIVYLPSVGNILFIVSH